jgi:hypothetical protein
MIQKVAVGLVAVILVTAAQGAERKRNAPDWKQDARDDIRALQGKDDTPAAQAPAQKQQPSLPPLPAAPRPSVSAVPETGIPVVRSRGRS